MALKKKKKKAKAPARKAKAAREAKPVRKAKATRKASTARKAKAARKAKSSRKAKLAPHAKTSRAAGPARKPAPRRSPLVEKDAPPPTSIAAQPGSATIGRRSPTEALTRVMTAKLGWVPDTPDQRDLMYQAAQIPVPDKIDMRAQCPPVYVQGELGCCTGNVIAAAIQFDRMRQGCADAAEVPSRMFIYYNERVIENTVALDNGAQLRNGIKAVAKLGACFEGAGDDRWPYDASKFAVEPPKPCYDAAVKNRALTYERLEHDLDLMKNCLASGHPFVFGFTIYASFDDIVETGIAEMPALGEGNLGPHAAMAVGFDDTQQRFICRNSWGTQWGQQGYFTIPYAYLANANLADDFWTIRTVEQQD